MRGEDMGQVLKYTFVDCNPVEPIGENACSHYHNYFIGNDHEKWASFVPNYKKVRYEEIWDNIDLVYYFNEEGLKYDLIIHPGADPYDIRIQIDGANDLSINLHGELVIGTDYCDILDGGLYTYYQDGFGGSIPCKFELINEFEYSFSLGGYDKSRSVVIDPFLAYSTFIGGSERPWMLRLITLLPPEHMKHHMEVLLIYS
jgi:hypothetical protein